MVNDLKLKQHKIISKHNYMLIIIKTRVEGLWANRRERVALKMVRLKMKMMRVVYLGGGEVGGGGGAWDYHWPWGVTGGGRHRGRVMVHPVEREGERNSEK